MNTTNQVKQLKDLNMQFNLALMERESIFDDIARSEDLGVSVTLEQRKELIDCNTNINRLRVELKNLGQIKQPKIERDLIANREGAH